MTITVTNKGLVNMAGVKETLLDVTGKKQTFVNSLKVNSLNSSHVLIAGGQP